MNAQEKAAATYNAASDHYDDPANSFWARFGRRTIERLDLSEGSRVLDVCCGSGASAIPAAQAVGPKGSVLGIDLSEDLLKLARDKARRHDLISAEFRTGDMLNAGLPDSAFDAVVCVFGIFFVPDMRSAVLELWRLVAPGGSLAVTTWGPRFFEPASTAFWNSIRTVRPDLYKGFNPWDRVCDDRSAAALVSGLGAHDIVLETGVHPVNTPENWWSMIMGSGYRGTVEQLDARSLDAVRADNLNYIRESGLTSVEANVIYIVVKKA